MKKHKVELLHTTIKFKYMGKPLQFDVLSNIHEYGSCIDDAFVSWHFRLSAKPSLLDFCRYVESKDTNFICHPKSRKEVTV